MKQIIEIGLGFFFLHAFPQLPDFWAYLFPSNIDMIWRLSRLKPARVEDFEEQLRDASKIV